MRRRAFTLVELLVVIGILLVLVGILVPAIQKVREAANRMVCGSRLRQIALAAHHYANDHHQLPFGYLGPSLAKNTDYPDHFREGQWIGHFPVLLPYLEQDAILRQIQCNFSPRYVSPLPWFWKERRKKTHEENYRVAMTRLKLFRCPSAPNYEPEYEAHGWGSGGTMVSLHVFNSRLFGTFTDGWKASYEGVASKYRSFGKTNYMGVAGCGSGDHPFFRQYAGVFTNRLSLSLAQISARDGTSNTLMYGEACGTMAWGSRPESMDISWMAGGGLGTYLGLQRASTGTLITFASYHTRGVQFSFADGSVRSLSYTRIKWGGGAIPPSDSQWLALQQLAGWRDGAVVDISALAY